jgi:hypothetical protein
MKTLNTPMTTVTLGNIHVQIHQHAQKWVAQIAHHDRSETPKLPVFSDEEHVDCTIQQVIDQVKSNIKKEGETRYHQKLLALSSSQHKQYLLSLCNNLLDANIAHSFQDSAVLINHHTSVTLVEHADAGWTTINISNTRGACKQLHCPNNLLIDSSDSINKDIILWLKKHPIAQCA